MQSHPEQLLELALKGGAEAAEVYYSGSSSAPVFFEANRLKQLEFIDSQGIALRLWQDGKPGLVVAYGPYEAQTIVDQALSLSVFNQTEDLHLATSASFPYDRVWGSAIDIKPLIEQGQQAIEQLRALYPDVICTGQWECSTDSMGLINTRGLNVEFEDTSVGAFLSGEIVRGEDFLQVYVTRSGPEFFGFADLIDRLGQYLGWAKQNTTAPQGKVPVLFTAKAADLLWGVVSMAMNGRQVEQNSTPWLDKKGECVTSTHLTLAQQPKFDQFYLPFDDEGTPTQAFTWLDRGVLQDFYTDRKIGSQLEIIPRGNGYRGALGGGPSPGLFNGIIEPGADSFEDLISSIDCGILVDQILGGGPSISGDFSVNIDLGYRIDRGQIVGRVKDTMLAGNAYTALQQVIKLGKEREWQGSLYLPAMIVDGLTVSSRA